MNRNSITPIRRYATFQYRFGYAILPSSRSYYDVLQVPLNSSGPEIKRAFIEMSKKYHPDANFKTRDPEKFVRVCEAYKILYRRASREHYNNRLKTRFRMVPPMDSSYTNKNVHKAWVKYQAAMRYKQFGHDIPSFGGSTVLHRKSHMIDDTSVRLLGAGKPSDRRRDGQVGRDPNAFNNSHDSWKLAAYMTAFSLIGALLALNSIDRVNGSGAEPVD